MGQQRGMFKMASSNGMDPEFLAQLTVELLGGSTPKGTQAAEEVPGTVGRNIRSPAPGLRLFRGRALFNC